MLDFCLGSISDEIETAPRLPLTDPIPDISDGMIVLRWPIPACGALAVPMTGVGHLQTF
jgi:hypothetical protein